MYNETGGIMRGKIIENVTILTKMMVKDIVTVGSTCIDATTGNGHDTLFLSELVGPTGQIYGFDIQAQAIETTREKLKGTDNVTLICDGHEKMETYVLDPVDFIIFNLGYLPKADKHITTKSSTTLQAIEASFRLLKCHGVLWVVVYPGHEEGAEESEALLDYVSNLEQKNYSVMRTSFLNQRNNPPYVIAIEKKYN